MANKVILLGNVGKAPELRETPNGSVVNFTMATTERSQNGTHTEWHNMTAYGKSAESIAQYVEKGSKLYIEGKIRTNVWKDKNDNQRETKKIIINMWEFAGSKVTENKPQDDFDDDIPF